MNLNVFILLQLVGFVELSWIREYLIPSGQCGLLPQGHLLPFGYHRQPFGEIEELWDEISPSEFNKRFVALEGFKPVVLRGHQLSSKAFQEWSDSYIKSTFGHYKVLTEVKSEKRQKFGKSLTNITNFLSQYNTTNQYVVTVMPDDMRRDVLMPRPLQCGTFSENMLELNFWMSSGGTASQVHYDADHNIHCLLAGKKSFIMINKDQYHKMQMERLEHTGSNFCPSINQNKVDMLKDPWIQDVEYQFTVMNAGDCIFLPSQYTHQVRGLQRTISVTLLWDPVLAYDNTGCAEYTYNSTASVADFHVVWNHLPNDLFFDVGYATPHIIRNELVELWEGWRDNIESSSDLGWTLSDFVEMMFQGCKWDLVRCSYTEMWAGVIAVAIDTDHNQHITRTELAVTSDDIMKAVSHFQDPPNLGDELYQFCTLGQEYIPPEAVSQEMSIAMKKHPSLSSFLLSRGFIPNSDGYNMWNKIWATLTAVFEEDDDNDNDDEGDDKDDPHWRS